MLIEQMLLCFLHQQVLNFASNKIVQYRLTVEKMNREENQSQFSHSFYSFLFFLLKSQEHIPEECMSLIL